MGHHAPGSSCSIFITSVIIVIFTVIVEGAGGYEITHGKVLNLPHPPPPGVRNHHSPHSTPTPTLSPLPPTLQMEVVLNGSQVRLELVKDAQFSPSVPLYELYSDGEGKDSVRLASLTEPQYSVYRDVTQEADFLVFPETDSRGNTVYKMEGIVHSGGAMFEVKTTGRKIHARHRRHTEDDGDNDDVNDETNDDDDDDEDEDEEEIEVVRLSDLEADNKDAVHATPSEPRRREMKETIPTLPPPAHLLSPPSPALPPLPPPLSPRPPQRRRKRAVTQDVKVDVVALADYRLYKTWYDRSNATEASAKRLDALEKIRRYYAFVMNGVDLLYQGISTLSYDIHVRLSSVVVATTAGSSTWTEQYVVSTSTQWDEVDASDALTSLKNWAASTDLLPQYDHLMLFTGYDLTKVTALGTTSDKITGLAYTSTLCSTTGQATSLVEDLGGFQCISTAAHELGHGLSAEHDGSQNDCRSQDRYIMAAGSYDVTSANKLNPWKFSSCSVGYFHSYIDTKVQSAVGRTCLYNNLTVSSNVPDVTSQRAGQLYDPDEQCRQVYGEGSRLCRGSEFGEASEVCTDMFCYDPTTTSTCFQLKAARGTTCGNGKWCEAGECVPDSRAPYADESCVFGDQPGPAFDGQNCTAFVDDFPGFCYQDIVRTRCCHSCARHYRMVTDCEYGDNATGCSSLSCPFAGANYLQSCCGTCDYGSTFTTTTSTSTSSSTTTTATPASTPSTATPPTTAPVSTASTASTSVRVTTEVCADNSSVTFNSLSCADLVTSGAHYCYQAQVVSHCCLACQGAHSGVTGCEYGDRSPSCSSVASNSESCRTQRDVCCQTCQGYTDSKGAILKAHYVIVYVISCVVGVTLMGHRAALPGL